MTRGFDREIDRRDSAADGRRRPPCTPRTRIRTRTAAHTHRTSPDATIGPHAASNCDRLLLLRHLVRFGRWLQLATAHKIWHRCARADRHGSLLSVISRDSVAWIRFLASRLALSVLCWHRVPAQGTWAHQAVVAAWRQLCGLHCRSRACLWCPGARRACRAAGASG